MNILCRLFGHKPPVYADKGWYSPGEEYGRLRRVGKDGIGRVHAVIECNCARCNEFFIAARVHEIATEAEQLYVVFDGPPSRISGRFVEVENQHGVSVGGIDWTQGDNGLWYLGPLKRGE